MSHEVQAPATDISDDAYNRILKRYGAPEERLPVIKEILAASNVTRYNLEELISISTGPIGGRRPPPEFSGSDKQIDQIAVHLQACCTQAKAHHEDFDD